MTKQASTLSQVNIKDEYIHYNSDVAICTLVADIQFDIDLEFTGAARRHPDDRPDSDVAVLVATARAYRSLALALERRAKGLVAHKDDVQRKQQILKLQRKNTKPIAAITTGKAAATKKTAARKTPAKATATKRAATRRNATA